MTAAPDLALALDAFNRGELGRARSLAETALETSPSPTGEHLLGLIHCRLGSPENGLSHLRSALEAEPRNLQYRTMLVRALIDCGRAQEALRHARRPAPGPVAADLWRLRAEAADAAGSLADRTEALTNLELEDVGARLVASPDDRTLRLQRARLLAALARDADAEQDYRRLLEGDPADAEAALELGLLLERSSRLDEVRRLVERLPGELPLLDALLAWRDGNPSEALEHLERVPPSQSPLRARELEARVQDSLGNSKAAFLAAKSRNEAVADHEAWRRSAREFRARLRDAAERITPEWAAAWGDVEPAASNPPAFLVGFPRSGTTLLDTFFMGHPQVHVIEEVPVLGLVAEQVGSLEAIASLDQSRTAELRQVYLDAIARNVPAGFDGIVIDKLPLNMLWAPLIYRLFPDAKLIFAQRHPCDCVLSSFLQSFALNPSMASFLDLGDAADFYDVAMTLWTRSLDALPIQSRSVAYEELVADPESSLRPLVQFLGLDWHEEMLDHRATAMARDSIGTPSYDQVAQPLNPRASGRWRRYEDTLQPVLPLLLPWADRLGYPQ